MSGLYQPVSHPHKPRNVRFVHAQERQSVNDKIAVFLTRVVGSMPTAYSFIVLAFIGLLAILGVLNPLVALIIAWASQTLIQLTLLPVIMVSQNVLGRHQELQSDEMFQTTQRTYHDIEQIMKHLAAQDKELIRQSEILDALTLEMSRQGSMLTNALTPRRRPMKQVEAKERD